jgi:hypothetical protein
MSKRRGLMREKIIKKRSPNWYESMLKMITFSNPRVDPPRTQKATTQCLLISLSPERLL